MTLDNFILLFSFGYYCDHFVSLNNFIFWSS